MKRARFSSDMKDSAIEIGHRIRNLRKQRNISQTTLAEMLGITQATVSNWEMGSSIPNAFELFRLSELFEVEVSIFKPTEDMLPVKKSSSMGMEQKLFLLEKKVNLIAQKVGV